jgi:uncharacterized repeat protein (TIGR03837 family)
MGRIVAAENHAMLWDVFCRVIDNHGDLGVCWRLVRDLAARGERTRLWVDDASALTWMAPDRPSGVEVHAWPSGDPGVDPGDVVVEAFGCELPPGFVARMAAREPAPHWINLEYLSAEAYVERSHRLASPQFSGPGRGLTKHFFYPGFTARTGGLLREPGVLAQQADFDGDAWLRAQGWARGPGERVVSLFAYAQPPLGALLELLPSTPTLLLACPGPLQAVVQPRPGLRVIALPYLSQDDYDRLLWSCDLNFVRGEDSFVRAQWAGKPYVWNIYPQDDGAHAAKLEAFIAASALPGDWAALWRAWNGLGAMPTALPADSGPFLRWREHLAGQPDLVTQLQGFLGRSARI